MSASILETVKRGTLGAITAGLVWCGNAAAADIANVPLFLTQSVEPNILFIIDDSGSMHLEIGSLIEEGTGNDNRDKERRVFPRREGPGGNTPLHNATPTFEDDNRWNYRLRSAAHNPLFYDPSVEYRPWVDWQGNELDPADPENVPIDPDRPNDDVRDLTEQLSEWTNWHDDAQNVAEETRSYWPITYFIYEGGDINVRDNYTRIEIRGDQLYIDGEARDADQLPSGRTIAEERQNFANWYTYYRNRKNTARAGIGRAFLGLPDDIRVGFGRINSSNQNVDGEGGTRAVIKGVRAFDASAREAFYDDLYGTSFGGGTPLRLALKGAGEYYRRGDDQGPWSSTPGVSSGQADTHLECRRSYTMLMTDGEWGGGSPNVGNVDGESEEEITGPDERSYTYTPEPPYEDEHSNMLADVAMHYWNRDLRTDLDNKVPTSETNPAFWQHMVTFPIGFGISGELDPETDLEALKNGDLEWSDHRVDDLWHAAINGRGSYLNATRPDEFTEGLVKVLNEIILRERGSSSSIATNSTRLSNDSEIYQARFNSADWTGELIAFGLESDGSVGDARWNAATQLELKGPASRNIITSKPDGTAVSFEWAQLADSQQSDLGDNSGVLDWLRGHRSDGDGFRNIGMLGDIVNSDPAYSGNADFGFRQLGDATQSSGYASYLSNRTVHPTVYVGANDGMLHAFNADTGEERFAYVPASVYGHLAELPQPGYQHRYYVDGSPKIFDAYVNSQWRTILIGTTGAGGSGIFALDVTDPTTFGTNDVLFDINDDDLADLGVTIPKATVARMSDGNFWAIFGNGYNSADGKAVLYLRNLDDGTTVTIDTEEDGSNGLSSPIPVDIDGDRVADRIYAGDLKGNLWRFDVDNSNTNQWGFINAFKQGSTPKPLFTAQDADARVQPITARPEVGRHPDGGLMVYFGTGSYFRDGDNAVSGSDARQSFYGIRDQDAQVAGRSALLMQEITFEGTASFTGGGDDGTGTNQAKVRVVSQYEDASKTGGFYLDLIAPAPIGFQGERVVSDAQLRFGRIVFTTLIPSTNPCSFGGDSWLMELDAFDGGSYGESVFDLNEDDNFDEGDYVEVSEDVKEAVSGLASEVGIVNKPSIITAGEVEFKYMSGSSGDVEVVKEISGSDLLGRQSWRQLR